MIQGELQQSQKQSALLNEGQKLTEVREMSRHGRIWYVCKLYGITLPLLGGHKTVELHNHKNQRLLEMIQIETNTVSLTLANQHMFLEERYTWIKKVPNQPWHKIYALRRWICKLKHKALNQPLQNRKCLWRGGDVKKTAPFGEILGSVCVCASS